MRPAVYWERAILVFCASWFFSYSPLWAKEFNVAVLGDAGVAKPVTATLQAQLKGFGVQRVALLGDQLYDPKSSYQEVWGSWLRDGFAFPWVAIGNHRKSVAEEVRFFGIPHDYYTGVDEAQARWIVLNSDDQELRPAEEQAQFLDRTLKAAAEPYVFVIFHHPPLTISARHQWKERERFHQAVRPILKSHAERVSAIFVGHDHISGAYFFEGVPLFVVGATWETFAPISVDLQEEGVHLRSHWLYDGATPSYLMLNIDSRTGTWKATFMDLKRERPLFVLSRSKLERAR
jgi:hypothetical protein